MIRCIENPAQRNFSPDQRSFVPLRCMVKAHGILNRLRQIPMRERLRGKLRVRHSDHFQLALQQRLPLLFMHPHNARSYSSVSPKAINNLPTSCNNPATNAPSA